MKMSEAFPSKYLKASDLQGCTVRVIMDDIQTETIGKDTRPVLYFKGKDKGLVLNKTNAGNIAQVYGDDTDAWMGHPLDMFPTLVDYQGKSVDAIRVKAPSLRPQPRPTAPVKTDHVDDGLDDSIPF